MPFLIDGYNLLHALGLPAGRTGPHGLAKARAGLVGLITAAHGDPADAVTVVFDARHPPPGADGEEFRGPVHVVFSLGEEADDRIEWLIAHDAAPKHLIVVSNDHRLQQAARRRGCAAWKCDDYLDWLDRRRRGPLRARQPLPDKPGTMSPAERERWLSEFGNLQDDPEFRDLFDAFGTDHWDPDQPP